MQKISLQLLFLIVLLIPLSLSAQEVKMVRVKGQVVSAEDGLPLVGVGVIGSSNRGVSTLVDGTYSISVPAGTTIQYQYIGYEGVQYLVSTTLSEVVHDVKMMSDGIDIDDVVVVAYGVRKKGTIAGSISTVKSDKINNVAAAGFDQALQGLTPGMTVLSNTGEPGAPASFQIRGVNSINSGTDPLFILDGIPISSADFSAISPSDIESVSILKDAASTSIYGARAANGVVVITTKQGRGFEKATVSYNMQLGFSDMAYGNWDIMNTAERLEYERELGILGDKNVAALSNINYDWRDVVYNKTAPLSSYGVSVSGASPVINYFVSANYYRQEGIAVGSDFRRYNLRANFSAKASNWLKIGTNTMMAYEETKEADEGSYNTVAPISASRFMMPYWSPYKADGSIASLGDGTWLGSNQNPLEWLENNPIERERYKVLSNIFAEATPTKGLVLRTQGAVDFTYQPTLLKENPSYQPNDGFGTVGRSVGSDFNLTVTNTANYQMDLNQDHKFNFLLGQEFVNMQYEAFTAISEGQNNDELLNLGSGTIPRMPSDSYSSSAFLSFFGRTEHNYKNKYFTEVSLRGDSSSKFGKDSRWAAFWSVGFMWNVRNEKFLENVSWLTNAQIAISSGTSGNSSIPPYDHLALVSGAPSYDGVGGLAPSSPGNEDLTWENLWTTNLAFRLGLWNRVNANLEFYNKKTTDMLMAVPISHSVSGFSSRWDNVGSMVNRGVEFDLNADVIRTKDFTWNLFANVSYNHNEITELYGDRDFFEMGTMRLEVGRPYGEFYTNMYAGVNPVNGDALWYTKDGDTVNEMREEDKVMTGKTWNSPWQGGFGTTVRWKGLSLSALFSWVGDRWMMNNDRFFDESNGTFTSFNQSNVLLYDRWKNPGDVTEIPRHGIPTQMDSHLLEDASFLRLKNMTVAYAIPEKFLNKTKFISSARLYVQGQNLLTFTKFSGMDPESNMAIYAAQYPMSRQYTFGLDITF